MSLVHYIFVRKDLPVGKLAAMVTHAAGESGAWWGADRGQSLPDHTTAVVLAADNEDHLRRILQILWDEGFEHEAISESSEPYTDQLMAIGLWPEEKEYFGDKLSHFKLLRDCQETNSTGVKLDNEDTVSYTL